MSTDTLHRTPALSRHYAWDKLFIDGDWRVSTDDRADIITPIDEKVFGSAPVGGSADIDAAIAAARRVFDAGIWSRAPRQMRVERMRRLIDSLSARREQAIELMLMEMGFPRAQCERQLELALVQMTRFIELAGIDPMKSLPLNIKEHSVIGRTLGGAITTRDPIGVVAAITPYNSGLALGIVKSFPAMAAGNSVVVKPSPYTPLQSLFLAELISEIDLPPGVFNVVTGGIEVGQQLCSDPRVDVVSFTGSNEVGAQVLTQAGPTLKTVLLELGGKSPLIIRQDADLEIACRAGIAGFVSQAGQGCQMTTRVIVDNRIRTDYVAALSEAVSHIKVGDPRQSDIGMGPLIRESARERTEHFCAKAIEEGARLVMGGRRPVELDRGFYFEPTIFDNVRNESYLAQNEVFGPILSVIGFDSDEEALRIANDTRFGLGGGIVSRDRVTAFQMAQQMQTGQISINGGAGFHPDTPFGGYKQSGLGREWGEEGYNAFTQIKAITFPVG